MRSPPYRRENNKQSNKHKTNTNAQNPCDSYLKTPRVKFDAQSPDRSAETVATLSVPLPRTIKHVCVVIGTPWCVFLQQLLHRGGKHPHGHRTCLLKGSTKTKGQRTEMDRVGQKTVGFGREVNEMRFDMKVVHINRYVRCGSSGSKSRHAKKKDRREAQKQEKKERKTRQRVHRPNPSW